MTERQSLLAAVRAIVGTVINLPPGKGITESENLYRLQGFDSLSMLELVTRLETQFGLEIPDTDLSPEVLASVGAIADYVLAWPGLSRKEIGSVWAAFSRCDSGMMDETDRLWTIPQLLDLAGHLVRATPPGMPIIAETVAAAPRLATALAADLLGVPVFHNDPKAPTDHAGLVVRDQPDPVDTAYDPVQMAGLELWVGERGQLADITRLPRGSHVFHTSGSTGHPIGVVRSAAAMLADARRLAAELGYAPGRAVLSCAPPFHAYGFCFGVLAPLLAGAQVRIQPPSTRPSQIARAASGLDQATLIALPFHYRLLAQALDSVVLDEVAQAVSSAAPLDVPTAEAVARRFRFRFFNAYGCTEAATISMAPVRIPFDPALVGRPMDGIQVRIRPVDDSEHGELLLLTDALASGYLDDGHITPLSGPDPWYATGDLAELADGEIRLLGRLGTMINVAGRKISPVTLEQVLDEHPCVVESQVLAAPDERRGQLLVARVVREGHLEASELLDWCRNRLTAHLVPHRIEFVDHLPKSATGKNMRHGTVSRLP